MANVLSKYANASGAVLKYPRNFHNNIHAEKSIHLKINTRKDIHGS